MMEFIEANQFLIVFAVTGFIWISYRVFTDHQARHHNRDEQGFDIVKSDTHDT